MKRVIIIDGRKFSDLEGFYNLMDKTLRDDDEEIMGHNLDAFNDLLRGGFGVFDNEHVDLHWTQFQKSSATLPQRDLRIILEIIDESENVTFFPED